ncbi:peptide-methionine (S)-S-oxide reductase MsrA [Reichenbachiella sp. MALMAid0571]|uniref:peptide-methionine (S)-S-oxide reductase MsrA n=1 Tax=Reichenbachiella sp. MALMAid0571 TaxID=3143939 RepID=UPI0032DEFF8E
MKTSKYILLAFSMVFSLACNSTTPHEKPKDLSKFSKAYFASGCFWCVEAIFQSVEGVEEVISGYSGGTLKNPTYEQVSSGKTRHAEAVEVYYDPKVVTYQTLLKVFFGSHDPTTPNQQGPDRGPQYRSMIYYQNANEEKLAKEYIKELNDSGIFGSALKIVTEVVPFKVFYKAEDYHQDYEERNPYQPYVMSVSIPRLNRFKEKYPELLKK